MNYSIICSTCNEYAPLLDGFLNRLKKHFKEYDGKVFTNIKINKDNVVGIDEKYTNLDFSSRLLKCIENIESEYLLFFLDDFYLTNNVNISFINESINALAKDKLIGCICLHDYSSDKVICKKSYNQYFSIKNKKFNYYCTTQISLWRKSFLKKILRKGESAWDFEILGSYRARHYKSLILYRNDKYSNCFSYPWGGIFVKGELRSECISLLTKGEVEEFSKFHRIIKNRCIFTKIFKYLLSYLYAFLSLLFKNIKRFGSPYYPIYVYGKKILISK